MPYQSFAESEGASRSDAKLAALSLPDLTGKHVLDVGCNEGFFCFAALDRGAAAVTGIDKNPRWISAAQERAEQLGVQGRASFLNQDWLPLPQGPFDVVLLTSALHYAKDQAGLLAHIATRMSDGGLLVFEGGVTSDDQPWLPVERGPKARRTTVYYPNRRTLTSLLKRDFAPRRVGASVEQSGDPIPRYVYHATKTMRVVLGLRGRAGSGKSTLATSLRRRGLDVLATDRVVVELVAGDDDGDLGSKIRPLHTDGRLGQTYRAMDRAGLWPDFAAHVAELLANYMESPTVVLDGVPLRYRGFLKHLSEELERRSLVLWVADRVLPVKDPS